MDTAGFATSAFETEDCRYCNIFSFYFPALLMALSRLRYQQVPFLDLTSTFRTVNLRSLDLNSDEGLCFFANLYHLLVMHMLLVLGPTSSAKVISGLFWICSTCFHDPSEIKPLRQAKGCCNPFVLRALAS